MLRQTTLTELMQPEGGAGTPADAPVSTPASPASSG